MPPEAVTIRGYTDSFSNIKSQRQIQNHLPTSVCISYYRIQDGSNVLPSVKDFDKGAI